MVDASFDSMPSVDLEAHERTYHAFVKGTVIFAVHIAIILLLLAIFLL